MFLTLSVIVSLVACGSGASPGCGPAADCEALSDCYSAAYAVIDACETADDCGLSSSSGEPLDDTGQICDGADVVRLDADLTEVRAIKERAGSCEWAYAGSPAVCEPYAGFACVDGRCQAAYE